MDQSSATPKKIVPSLNTPVSTPNVRRNLNLATASLKKNASKFLLFPMATNTPSPSRLTTRIVKNPFENHLAERLLLPVISSPSLFHHPSTPKQSLCEHFEWTIDEVSSLNPVNLIPHETQFKQDIDPIVEARAQDAIRSFFAEHKIVPSPKDCALRKHKIILKDQSLTCNIMSSTAKSMTDVSPNKRRDSVSQTTLTFPPTLSKEVEDMLQKFQICDEDDDKRTDDSLPDNDKSMMDLSTLRRKLFINPSTPKHLIMDEEVSYEINLSPAPKTPDLAIPKRVMSSAQKMQNLSFGSDMFGELSPIGNTNSSFGNMDISIDMNATPSSRIPKLQSKAEKKSFKRKNLSNSFCLLHKELNDSMDEMVSNRSSNNKSFRTEHHQNRLPHLDSGFNECDILTSQSEDFMEI